MIFFAHQYIASTSALTHHWLDARFNSEYRCPASTYRRGAAYAVKGSWGYVVTVKTEHSAGVIPCVPSFTGISGMVRPQKHHLIKNHVYNIHTLSSMHKNDIYSISIYIIEIKKGNLQCFCGLNKNFRFPLKGILPFVSN